MSGSKKYYLFLIAVFFSCTLFSSEPLPSSFSPFLQNLDRLEKNRLDGEIVVAQGNQILYKTMSPKVEEEGGAYPQFLIGSISKQFTAVAFLKALYEKLTFEDATLSREVQVEILLQSPLSLFLPREDAIWESDPPFWIDQVTLHQLLTHTSGIKNYANYPRFSEFYLDRHSSSEIIHLVTTQPLLFQPGSDFAYCNTGYVLLAEITERITQKTFSSYLEEEIFQKVGMHHTSHPDQGDVKSLKQLKKYTKLVSQSKYDPKSQALFSVEQSEDLSIAKGASACVSTAEDLILWNLALHKDRKILNNDLYGLWSTSQGLNYGYGVEIHKTKLGTMYGHYGNIGSYRTALFYFPKYDVSIAFLTHVACEEKSLQMAMNAKPERGLPKIMESFLVFLRGGDHASQ